MGSHIIVVRHETKEKTEGGLILPAEAQRAEKLAAVVEVGPDCKFLAEGDTVLVPDHAGTHISLGGMTGLLLLEEEIQVRIKEVAE